MPICPGRLLPNPRTLRHCKLQVESLSRTPPFLPDATSASAPGTRCVSKYAPAHRRRSRTKQKGVPSKEQEAEDPRDTAEPSRPRTRLGDAAAWIDALEPLIPQHLHTSSHTGRRSTLNAKERCAAITHIIAGARETNRGIDLLAELGVKHGRWSAVLLVVESLVADASTRIKNDSLAELPSNLDWPMSTPLEEMASEPIELDQIPSSDNESFAQWDQLDFDPCHTDGTASEKSSAIPQIWMSLGSVILEAADLPSEKSNQVMVYAYQIIARLHNSGFVPDHVYSYFHTGYDSALRRPPILHLLASRILTTLSDAVWRAHQDEVIAQAANAGANYQDLGLDPPGGRFRLKVRELGPEVWLEFILWCCADGGFATAGSWIVERMRTRNTDSPWFATEWTSAAGDGASDQAFVDWDIVKLRHGGTVGQIEGYSRERPFVEMERRTISVEVVLALVEASIDARSPDVEGRGCTQGSAQTSVSRLLMFLEPHRLPQRYFDYITVRLLQPLLFDFEKDSTTLHTLVEAIRDMRTLEITHKPTENLPSLEIDSILEQSEVFAGILHQALESLAVAGRVSLTVEMFHQIQRLVDQSKLRSIGSFLHSPWRPDKNFFSPRDFAFSQEYTLSHGQLPAQKLAPFLDIVTNAGLIELGDWLFYSMDVDGPLIPLDLYSKSSLSPSILRFAAAKEDRTLMEDVADTIELGHRKAPVSYLRSYTDARVQIKDFENAGHTFAALSEAKGGGNNLYNVATIIATMIRIEHSAKHTWEERRPRYLSPGLALLDWVLSGDFRGNPGDFGREHIRDYRRGLACLLRVVEAIPETCLSDVSRSWLPTLSQSNVVGLSARAFDVVLSAVVQTRGAKVGMMLWDLFCKVPPEDGEKGQDCVNAADTTLVSAPKRLEMQSDEAPLSGSTIWTRDTMTPHRIDKSSRRATNNAYSGLNMDATSEDVVSAGKHSIALVGKETDLDVNRLPFSSISIDQTGLATVFHSVGNKSSMPGKQNPPNADISLLPAAFNEMISDQPDPPSSMEDDVLPLTYAPGPPNPVVRPTFRTLRIIVRGALMELEAAKALWYTEDDELPTLNITDVPAKANMRALETAMTDIKLVEQWAKPLFRRFGLSDDDVAVEFGWKLGEKDNIFSTEELKKRHAAARTEYELAKMGMLADLSEVNIRKRFLGPPVRKTKMKVDNYTPRELAFYSNKQKPQGKEFIEGELHKGEP